MQASLHLKEIMIKALKQHILKNLFPLAMGVIIGIFAWIFDENKLSADILRFTTRFGESFAALVLASTLLAFIAAIANEKVARLAFKTLKYVIKTNHHKMPHPAFFLFAVSITAFICWIFSGSTFAIGSALNAAILSATLLYCWHGLGIIFDELNNQLSHVNH